MYNVIEFSTLPLEDGQVWSNERLGEEEGGWLAQLPIRYPSRKRYLTPSSQQPPANSIGMLYFYAEGPSMEMEG